MQNKNKTFKTSSLAISAVIQTLSPAKLKSIDFSDPRRAEFIFDKSEDPNLDQMVNKFFNKDLSVDAFSYFENLRLIKSRLYERKNAKS